MPLRLNIWPRCVLINSLQFHVHFGIEICCLMLLNFDMTLVKTKNFLVYWLIHGHMTSRKQTVSHHTSMIEQHLQKRATFLTSEGSSALLPASARDQTVTKGGMNLIPRVVGAFFKLLFFHDEESYTTNRLTTDSSENRDFCFPRISMFPSTSSRKTSRFSGNKIHCFPRDQSINVYCI